MLKNVRPLVSSLSHWTGSPHCGSLAAQTFDRYLSTNSAINKGLRKSRHGRSRLDPPARLGGITRRGEYGRGADDSRYGEPSLNPRNTRRSEYRREIDNIEHGRPGFNPRSRPSIDGESPVTSRKGSLTLRQRQDIRATGSNASQSRHGPPYDFPRRSQTISPRSAPSSRGQYQSGNLRVKASSLNRAERRAAAFGHKEKPPEGYKALPIASEKQDNQFRKSSEGGHTVAPRHLSSSWRADSDGGPATKDSTIEKRWADKPARRNGLEGSEGRSTEPFDDRPRRKSTAPLAIPYTTPASEFLYGHSVVTAALKFSRRKFYKLYLYNGDTAEVRGQDREVRKLALAANVEVTRVGTDWLRLMDKMSAGRPHNVGSKSCRNMIGTELMRSGC